MRIEQKRHYSVYGTGKNSIGRFLRFKFFPQTKKLTAHRLFKDTENPLRRGKFPFVFADHRFFIKDKSIASIYLHHIMNGQHFNHSQKIYFLLIFSIREKYLSQNNNLPAVLRRVFPPSVIVVKIPALHIFQSIKG